VYGDVRALSFDGDHVLFNRTNSLYVPTVTIATSSDYVPIASIRKKNSHVKVNTYLEGFDVICSSPQVIMVTTGSTLTGSSWQTLPLQVATETAVEYDTSASVVSSDGIMIWQGLAPSGSMTFKIPKCLMNGTSPVVISAKNASSSGEITLVVRAIEAW
jgi:tricorn protease-like protein